MIIGLHGKMGSGKDAIYTRICHLLTGSVEPERVGNADYVKSFFTEFLGISLGELERNKRNPSAKVSVVINGDKISERNFREALQSFGGTGRRLIGEDFWVDAVLPLELDHSDRLIIVPDIRHPNEAERIIDLGGIIYFVDSPVSTIEKLGHDDESEIPLPEYFASGHIDNTKRDDNFKSLDKQIQEKILDRIANELPN